MKHYIKQKLKQLNFLKITPIQKQMFNNFEKPYHLVCVAPTGTGKTHAYLLPILSKINWQKNTIQAIIITPTNELGWQILNMLKKIEPKIANIKILYGGINKQKISDQFKKKQPPLLITTLSKLNEYVLSHKLLKIHKLDFLVLEEADMLFDQDSLSILDIILTKCNPKIIIISASITDKLKPFINKYFGKNLFLNTTQEHKLKLNYYNLLTTTEQKLKTLIHLIQHINPYISIIFVSNIKEQAKIYEAMVQKNLKVICFSSALNTKKRKQYINDIQKAKYQYIIASDIMARGLDLDIDLVIHYDLPHKNLDFFQHRNGRTGRMEKSGDIIVLMTEKDELFLDTMQKKLNISFKQIQFNNKKNQYSLITPRHNQISKNKKYISTRKITK
ncbi:DEAD/DEAH box helicase [Candidatus Phytoplasma fabacearum]|uniref:DEAD/DEAH box helicase n=1 Tax=Candidatus Phytoplasma fabacearum TaxID=2982628 RepID=A0ABU8ZSR6_9MOLU|nr:DEAD/DEAH box helicase ['Bituminaria bituminosa' little leaf phytoplasma]MDV3153994.1 DEAD/DEAH box helicase [Pigeon pea little leaf phytoplasma]MDO7983464.1 DEAD/DEAH box helicase ['Bituminaria bituminosa' little leaf phytoplasma]MDO8023781.1 DEAD/DEAH box helicase ['Bituminaria bituminosa' little leaf phytoplasma]MDO8030400.1 DEAD/DEAH box helicase ['Bituminaria bituminosa' little leaf phytoplasma]MDV3163218.1 DEAD/DEAH box helicase [Pigeon pea little leaf phytoplasma]